MKRFQRSIVLLAVALASSTAHLAHAQTARVQVIHNCADAAATEVDVWLDNALLLDDFAFRSATPFIDAPAGVPFTVGIAPSGSMSAAESIFTQEFTLEEDGSYIIVASGIVSPTGYSPSPPFSLQVFAGARETAAGPGTDVLAMHGSTDAPMVDVYETEVAEATVIDDLEYGQFAGYLELPTSDLVLQVRTADNTAIVAAYAAPLATLGLSGEALTVLASGFLDPAMNSNGPAFGLFVALASGGDLVELPAVALPAPARAQVIHNSADAAAAEVDVYLNGSLLLDDFAFRTATPFVDLGSGVDVNIAIAPSTSTSVMDAIAEYTFELEENGTYVIVANGIVSASGYTPAAPFDLYVAQGRESASMAGNTDVLVFHGATDAPTVDVAETALLGGTVIVDDISYGEFSPGYLEVATADLMLQVQTTDGTPVSAHAAPLATMGLTDAALVVLASGFLDPSVNSNGAPFGLWAALPSGGALVELMTTTGIEDGQGSIDRLNAWPNPAADRIYMSFNTPNSTAVFVRLVDMKGRMVHEHSITFSSDRLEMDVQHVPNGVYLLEVRNGDLARTVPVIVQR